MRRLNRTIVAASVLSAVSLGTSSAQECMVASTMVSAAGTLVQVLKTLSNSYTCELTMFNASFCTPSTAGTYTNFLRVTVKSGVRPA